MNWLIHIIERLFCFVPRLCIINPDESGVRVTLGRNVKATPPGWYIFVPLFQEITVLTVTQQVVDLRAQSVLTSDRINMCFSGGVCYRVSDATKAILEVQNFDSSLRVMAMGIITRHVSENSFEDINDMAVIENIILNGLRDAAAGWGLKIMRVYITDIGVTKNLRVLTESSNSMIVDNGDE